MQRIEGEGMFASLHFTIRNDPSTSHLQTATQITKRVALSLSHIHALFSVHVSPIERQSIATP